MSFQTLPVWSFDCNWVSPVLETLEWKTDILTSKLGVEQRRALRQLPRRTMEASYLHAGPERAAFDLFIAANGGKDCYVPLLPDGTPLARDVPAGSAFLPLRSTYGREFNAGGLIVIRRDTFAYEMAEVDVVTPSGLYLVSPTTAPWKGGEKVFPVFRGHFTDQPDVTRHGPQASISNVRFRQQGAAVLPPSYVNPLVYSAAAAQMVSYNGVPILSLPPNEAGTFAQATDRLTDTFDPGFGPIAQVDRARLPFEGRDYRWLLANADQRSLFRNVLYAMKGRRRAFWLPTFNDDLIPTEAISASNRGLRVRQFGFARMGGPATERRTVLIVLRDGTVIPRLIVSAQDEGATELVVLDKPLGVNVPLGGIRRISFMSLARQDQDAIEISHVTDVEGPAQVTSVFRTLPARRRSMGWGYDWNYGWGNRRIGGRAWGELWGRAWGIGNAGGA